MCTQDSEIFKSKEEDVVEVKSNQARVARLCFDISTFGHLLLLSMILLDAVITPDSSRSSFSSHALRTDT